MGLFDFVSSVKDKAGLKMMTICAVLGLCACTQKPEVLPPPRVVVICPRIITYPQSVLDDALREKQLYGAKIPTLLSLLGDYSLSRDAVRACQKEAAEQDTQSVPTKK